MQLSRSLTSLSIAILAFTMFLVFASDSTQAQGQRFSSEVGWLDAITGTPEDVSESIIMPDSQTACFEVDAANGELEGFLLRTPGFFPPTVSLFDGDTLVETVPLAAGDSPFDLDAGVFFYGWTNTDGINVTKIQLDVIPTRLFVFEGIELSFFPEPVEPPVEPPAETCFDQLTNVKTEIENLLATATGRNANKLQSAFDCVCWIQDDSFWVQPSGDRLTAYGSNVFLGAAYTILYLERVDDPQADVIIDELINVLECVVDREIEFAIANDGAQQFIDKAVKFADLGDIIDDEFDNEVIASLAYRLAWLNAFYSTY